MSDVLLEWIQSPDDPTLGGDVSSYELARSNSPNPTSIVATVPATAVSGDTLYRETLTAGAYWWRVRAVSVSGRRSPWSAEVSSVLTGDLQLPPLERRASLTFELRIVSCNREHRRVET